MTALLDTGSSLSFIRYVAKRLNLKINSSSGHVQMASSNLITNIIGSCVVKLEIFEHKCDKINLLLIKNLCSDIILRQDFFKLHRSITFNFDGAKDNIKILHLLEACSSAASVEPPSLFSNLTANCKPIATKSRRFNTSDNQFIKQEVKKLLDKNIIEPSKSPWRAQVLVTQSEHHKEMSN